MPEQRESGLLVPDGAGDGPSAEDQKLAVLGPALVATAQALDAIADDEPKAEILERFASLDDAGLRLVEKWAGKLERMAGARRRQIRKAEAKSRRR